MFVDKFIPPQLSSADAASLGSIDLERSLDWWGKNQFVESSWSHWNFFCFHSFVFDLLTKVSYKCHRSMQWCNNNKTLMTIITTDIFQVSLWSKAGRWSRMWRSSTFPSKQLSGTSLADDVDHHDTDGDTNNAWYIYTLIAVFHLMMPVLILTLRQKLIGLPLLAADFWLMSAIVLI